jgi:hypothetical protein
MKRSNGNYRFVNGKWVHRERYNKIKKIGQIIFEAMLDGRDRITLNELADRTGISSESYLLEDVILLGYKVSIGGVE